MGQKKSKHEADQLFIKGLSQEQKSSSVVVIESGNSQPASLLQRIITTFLLASAVEMHRILLMLTKTKKDEMTKRLHTNAL